jgi:hypothetical protein
MAEWVMMVHQVTQHVREKTKSGTSKSTIAYVLATPPLFKYVCNFKVDILDRNLPNVHCPIIITLNKIMVVMFKQYHLIKTYHCQSHNPTKKMQRNILNANGTAVNKMNLERLLTLK